LQKINAPELEKKSTASINNFTYHGFIKYMFGQETKLKIPFSFGISSFHWTQGGIFDKQNVFNRYFEKQTLVSTFMAVANPRIAGNLTSIKYKIT
jgi:hypothetical protein